MAQDGQVTETLLTPEQGLAEFERNAGRIVNLLADAELDAPVPGCPGWTLTDLVGHTGGIHTWARHAIVTGSPDGPDHGPEETDRDALIGWYAEVATSLADVLRSTDPATPTWNFGPKPRTAAFWFRRQAHETAVHLWDAETSQGRAQPIDEAVALDGIDEVVTLMFPRQVRLGRIPPLAGSLKLEANGRSWVLRGDGAGPSAHDHGDKGDRVLHDHGDGGGRVLHDHGEGLVGGTAEAVLLLLWGRIDLDDDRLTLTGDRGATEAVLKAGIVP